VDRYTKLVLTVIALALVWIAARPIVPLAHADAPAVVTCVLPDVIDVNIAEVYGLMFGPITVESF